MAADILNGHPAVKTSVFVILAVMPAGLPLCQAQSLPSTVSIEGYEAGIHPSLPPAPDLFFFLSFLHNRPPVQGEY